MLQRKQTLFLLVALAALVACLMLPVGRYQATELGVDSAVMCNLWIARAGAHDLTPWPLFAILVTSSVLLLATIFTYKTRKLQSRLCVGTFFLMLVWYAVYVLLTLNTSIEGTTFSVSFAACLPLVAALATLWARKGILYDEWLVRSADRIR